MYFGDFFEQKLNIFQSLKQFEKRTATILFSFCVHVILLPWQWRRLITWRRGGGGGGRITSLHFFLSIVHALWITKCSRLSLFFSALLVLVTLKEMCWLFRLLRNKLIFKNHFSKINLLSCKYCWNFFFENL